MFFVPLGRIVAMLALAFGIAQILIGVSIATGTTDPPYEAALARYPPGASSSGEVIGRGLYKILFSIAVGIAAEIGYAL